MQTIGVIGGMGPQATMDFEARVHAVSQRLIPPSKATGYPTMIVYYCRHAPLLLHPDGAPILPPQVHPGLLHAAKVVGAAADFIVMTANGPHGFQALVEQEAGRPVLSMIELTIAGVQRRGLRQIGVIELGTRTMYAEPLVASASRPPTFQPKCSNRLTPASSRIRRAGQGQRLTRRRRRPSRTCAGSAPTPS